MTLKEKYDLLFDKRDELENLSKELELQSVLTYSDSIVCFLGKKELYEVAEELEIENVSFRERPDEYIGEWFFMYRGVKFYYLVRNREDL